MASTLISEIYNYSNNSVFESKEVHDLWLIEISFINEHKIIIDRRGDELCCKISPYCPWCLLDFVCRLRIKRFVKKWSKFRNNRFNYVFNRQLNG